VAAEQSLLLGFEQLRLQLNRDLFLGLFELESHYAWYPPGAAYARHVDQPYGRSARRVSLVLYLNENWDQHAGGDCKYSTTAMAADRSSRSRGAWSAFWRWD